MEYIKQVLDKDITRRTVLAGLGTTAIGSQTASAVPTFSTERRSSTQDRLEKAYELRKEIAHEVLAPSKGLPEQTPNGDHKRYDKKIADFTKGLPHNRLGRSISTRMPLSSTHLRRGDHRISNKFLSAKESKNSSNHKRHTLTNWLGLTLIREQRHQRPRLRALGVQLKLLSCIGWLFVVTFRFTNTKKTSS
ncbi:hypothetical protein ACFQL7_04415 [Halocatena marina]|uniref:Uncharacterized protein n=1 Tax=Halocatena marina TaxID=2934937 RepID=A0ABD5YII1_9EURY